MQYDGVDGAFSARPTPLEEANTRLALQRLGVSSVGADQFLRGQVVVNPADRSKLARFKVVSSELERFLVST